MYTFEVEAPTKLVNCMKLFNFSWNQVSETENKSAVIL